MKYIVGNEEVMEAVFVKKDVHRAMCRNSRKIIGGIKA